LSTKSKQSFEDLNMGYRVGVDIGGTFTDFCIFHEETGLLKTLKVLSRPDEPGAEVTTGLDIISKNYDIAASSISYFTHGTTVGVNTVIQRKGVKLCLFTTENFEDVLEVARLKMPDPYDLYSGRPEPLVTREKVFGIRERILSNGDVDIPVDEKSVRDAISKVKLLGGEAIVISLLHSYRNPEHEKWIAEIIRLEAPEISVILASDIWPVIREYERTVTATVSGYVQPKVEFYLSSLQSALKASGVGAEPMITKSNGGVMTAERGKTDCAQMLLSGTASGVMGAASIAKQIKSSMCMSLDIGGTSADVAIIVDGNPQFGAGEMIGEFPVYIPSVSVTSIGEGGGSVAWVDDQGVLKVGPESAGSTPGPACYGRGGIKPTITDALVVLGFLGNAALGYSAVDIQIERAREAISPLANSLSMTTETAAESIIRIAVSGMYLEISKLVSRQGVDPRDLSLIAFGGAGPMLACWLAEELSMKNVVVPLVPGVLSAFGGLVADIKNDFIKTIYLDLSPSNIGDIQKGFGELAREAMRWIREDQGFEGAVTMKPSADLRYRGQSYEIDAELEAQWIEEGNINKIAGAFHVAHEKIYEHSDEKAEIQIINLRMVIIGEPKKPEFKPFEKKLSAVQARQEITVFENGDTNPGKIYRRSEMRAGDKLSGPAVIIQDDCTTCVPTGFDVLVDGYGNLIIQGVI
jgi:N-methylhydantoinase A